MTSLPAGPASANAAPSKLVVDHSSQHKANLMMLQKKDPEIQRLLDSTGAVTLYDFEDSKQTWCRTNVEGSLHLVERSTLPKYQLFIINRLNPENWVESVHSSLQVASSPPYLFLKNGKGKTQGLWFYHPPDREKMSQAIEKLIEEVKKEEEQHATSKDIMRFFTKSGSIATPTSSLPPPQPINHHATQLPPQPSMNNSLPALSLQPVVPINPHPYSFTNGSHLHSSDPSLANLSPNVPSHHGDVYNPRPPHAHPPPLHNSGSHPLPLPLPVPVPLHSSGSMPPPHMKVPLTQLPPGLSSGPGFGMPPSAPSYSGPPPPSQGMAPFHSAPPSSHQQPRSFDFSSLLNAAPPSSNPPPMTLPPTANPQLPRTTPAAVSLLSSLGLHPPNPAPNTQPPPNQSSSSSSSAPTNTPSSNTKPTNPPLLTPQALKTKARKNFPPLSKQQIQQQLSKLVQDDEFIEQVYREYLNHFDH